MFPDLGEYTIYLVRPRGRVQNIFLLKMRVIEYVLFHTSSIKDVQIVVGL